MLEFTHCQDCGLQRQQGNFCPLCNKCYSDDDFESKMVHCVQCDHWVHAECQGITLDQYECLSDLPEEVQFICRQCCSEQETLNWYKELMEEMEAGYERVKSSLFYKQYLSQHFSKSLKGSSRVLMLFALNTPKIQMYVRIEHALKKSERIKRKTKINKTHTQQLTQAT